MISYAGSVTDLQRLADALATDYLHGRWHPEPPEEQRMHILSADSSAASGLERLDGGGVITAEAIEEALSPAPTGQDVEQWRTTAVLRAYPDGDPFAQALVRDLVHAISAGNHPGLTPYPDRYTEAPAPVAPVAPTVFLAGEITGAWTWQLSAALQLLATSPVHVLNPRRAYFPAHDLAATREQIAWEYATLRRSDVILFWFPVGAVQPIALYEIGAHAVRNEAAIAVGTDPAYARRVDVVEQLRHVRPGLEVHDSLPATVYAATDLLRASAPGSRGRLPR